MFFTVQIIPERYVTRYYREFLFKEIDFFLVTLLCFHRLLDPRPIWPISRRPNIIQGRNVMRYRKIQNRRSSVTMCSYEKFLTVYKVPVHTQKWPSKLTVFMK
jgi:hypothetical protein